MNLRTNVNALPLNFLGGRNIRLASHGLASDYAIKILGDLGVSSVDCGEMPDPHPAIAWATSGLMWLTGTQAAAPLICPAPVASCADGALRALAALPGGDPVSGLSVTGLLSGRAAHLKLGRGGDISANGQCRLVQAADGWIALNLARETDWDLIPAWLEDDLVEVNWETIVSRVAQRSVAPLLAQADLLGLPFAEIARPRPMPWVRVTQSGPKASRQAGARPLVIDLSSLWAGPLASYLLVKLGARVIKVEDRQRADGARGGNLAFYDRLNAQKESLALNMHSEAGVQALRTLIDKADIVIEGSRPRALKQLGLDADAQVSKKPGLIWVSITGYGREPKNQNRVAFGDDAAVAGGLTWLMHQACGERVFCGDAIADPLTGLHAALASWAGWLSGEGALLDIALSNVVRHVCTFQTSTQPDALTRRVSEWQAILEAEGIQAARPTIQQPAESAAQLGAHNDQLSAEFGFAC